MKTIGTTPDWATVLRNWRRVNNMKQLALASLLGVSQPTIAKWESGADIPSPPRQRQIRDLIAGSMRDELAIERLLIRRQGGVRTLVDLDGIRLMEVSQGYRTLWPQFSELIGVPLADHVANELQQITTNAVLISEIRRGSVALISGISRRNFTLGADPMVPHRWHICFRRFGARIYSDTIVEPCAADLAPQITEIIHIDELGHLSGT